MIWITRAALVVVFLATITHVWMTPQQRYDFNTWKVISTAAIVSAASLYAERPRHSR